MISFAKYLATLTLVLLTGAALAAPIGPGDGEQTANLLNNRMKVFTYRPDCPDPTILLVFHGLNRNAERYRDSAHRLADRACTIVVAPLFDNKRFPTWRYQRGGIVEGRELKPPREWTGRMVIALADWTRKQEGRALPFSLIGHSAGGQFLSRVAAFVPTGARRIVVANPSTYVFPSLDVAAPFGLRGVYPGREAETALRRYLATPMTIYLGEEDTGDENRNDSREAKAQGETRYDRGRNAFAAGQKAAQMLGTPFNWRLIELPGAGHNARQMFSSPEALKALAP